MENGKQAESPLSLPLPLPLPSPAVGASERAFVGGGRGPRPPWSSEEAAPPERYRASSDAAALRFSL